MSKSFFTKVLALAGVNLTSSVTAPVDGDAWYASGVFNFRENGVTKNFGSFLGAQMISAGTAYVPTAGTKRVVVRLQGAGAGGGNSTAGLLACSAGSGGGAGELKVFNTLLVTGTASYVVAIGAAGAAASDGGSTSITINGTTYTAAGGKAGANGSAGGTVGFNDGGDGGGNTGAPGLPGVRLGTGSACSGTGGSGFFGKGGKGRSTDGAGIAASGYGAGGGGSCSITANYSGGAGAQGFIVVEEFG